MLNHLKYKMFGKQWNYVLIGSKIKANIIYHNKLVRKNQVDFDCFLAKQGPW